MTNPALAAAGRLTQKFAPPMGRVLGFVAIGFLAVMVVIAVVTGPGQSRDFVLYCAAFALIAWVALVRPWVTAFEHGLVLRNMLRDTFLPWSCVRRCRVSYTLQVATDSRIYHGLGVSKSARANLVQQSAKQGTSPPKSSLFGRVPPSSVAAAANLNQEVQGGNYFDYVEAEVERMASRAEPDDAATPLVVWSVPAVAATTAAVILLVVASLLTFA